MDGSDCSGGSDEVAGVDPDTPGGLGGPGGRLGGDDRPDSQGAESRWLGVEPGVEGRLPQDGPESTSS